MRYLGPPTISVALSYITSISRIRNADLKNRLDAIAQEIEHASDAFELAAQNHQISKIPTYNSVGPITGTELQDVYTQRFAKLNSPGRPIYDEILACAPNGTCPLCGHRDATTLDHYLPKATYPALVVTPLNLVPACKDCNHSKLDTRPTTEEEVTLHPYFDNVEDAQWLFATVNHTQPASFSFFVRACERWTALLSARIKYHFNALGLAGLYSAQAANELTNIRWELQCVYTSDGPAAVAEHLDLQAKSRERARTNSWQVAMYQAMTSSTWFCNGGYA